MLLDMQQILQLYALLNCLKSSAYNNGEKIKRSNVNYMNQTGYVTKPTQTIRQLEQMLTSVNPLSVWLNKGRNQTLKSLRIDATKIPSCIENRENLRFELVLLKVLKREAINVVIFGGSNCAQGMFPVLLRDWWNEVITPITGSGLNMKVIGIGGTGSSYYQFCHEIYLDKNETIDLVILETAVNDVMVNIVARESNFSRSLPLEQLTRQLLKRPNNPAVFYVNMFIVKNKQCLNLVDYGQRFISNLYGITTFNLRCLSCRFFKGKFYSDSSTDKVQDDKHRNILGHAQVALMLIHVISKTFEKMAKDINGFAVNGLPSFWFDAVTSIIPPLPLAVYIKGESSTIRSPKCWANLKPNYKKSIVRNTLSFGIVENAGFNYLDQVMVIGRQSYSAENVPRKDSFGGLFATKINSQVKVSFALPPQRCESIVRSDSDAEDTDAEAQTLRSSFSSSVGVVSRYGVHGGTVDVWLDDLYDKRITLRLQNPETKTAVIILATRVEPGMHTLTMQIVEKGDSVLVGVFLGACDWP